VADSNELRSARRSGLRRRGVDQRPAAELKELDRPTARGAVGKLVRFTLIACAVYGLLVAAKPFAREPYARAHARFAQGAFHDFGSSGMTRFEVDMSDPGLDTDVLLMKRGVSTGHRLSISAWRLAYLPTAELIALALATPIAWRRRFRALSVGLVVIHVLILLRVWILLIFRFSRDYPCRLYEFSPLWDRVIDFVYDRAFAPTTASFLVPALVWIAVTFRREDVDRLRGAPTPAATIRTP
jgi:hypothetical protein